MSYLRNRLFCACAAMTLLCLSACTDDAANGEAQAVTGSPGAERASYRLVTVLRPESVADYFKRARSLYDACRTVAQMKSLPVKPFPALPQNFVHSRVTQVSDGKRFLHSEEQFAVDGEISPSSGCEVKVTSQVSSSVFTDGTRPAQVPGDEGPADLDRALDLDPARLTPYTVARTVHGVRLKCDPSATAAADDPGVCIVDPAAARGALATPDGKPLVAHHVRKDQVFGTKMVLEPESFITGTAIDTTVFNVAAP